MIPRLIAVVMFRCLIPVRSMMSTVGAASAAASTQIPQTFTKDVWILRHGQATHNPRAEAAKAAGCSFEEFFELMRQDDSLDSPLTELGRQQARAVHDQYGHWLRQSRLQLIVSSPLSRALETADRAFPHNSHNNQCLDNTNNSNGEDMMARRICYENFREINGVLKNAQRRSVPELQQLFPAWNFADYLESMEDSSWNEDELESREACRERGYQGFRWLFWERPETRILLVAHGGILYYTMSEHPHVMIKDGRRSTKFDTAHQQEQEGEVNGANNITPRCVHARFENCELRRYQLSCIQHEADGHERMVFTEVDFDHVHEKEEEGAQAT